MVEFVNMKTAPQKPSRKSDGYIVFTVSVAERTIKVHVHPDETGGYWVDSPTLKGLVTQAETLEEAVENAIEAAALLLEE